MRTLRPSMALITLALAMSCGQDPTREASIVQPEGIPIQRVIGSCANTPGANDPDKWMKVFGASGDTNKYACGAVINLEVSASLNSATTAAKGIWNTALLHGLPSFGTVGTSVSSPKITVSYPGSFSYYCGATDFNSGAVTLYGSSTSGDLACGPSNTLRSVPSAQLSSLIAHELGHALGFEGHITATQASHCINKIPASPGTLNTEVCLHEKGRIYYAYGMRSSDVNTAQHFVVGVVFSPTSVSIGLNGSTGVTITHVSVKQGVSAPSPVTVNGADNFAWSITGASPSNVISLTSSTGQSTTVQSGSSPGSAQVEVEPTVTTGYNIATPWLSDEFSSLPVTVNPPVGTITINAGNNQSATVNTNVATAPSVLVRWDGVAKPGVVVTFAVTAGGGSMVPVSGLDTTDGSGIASLTSWKMGTTAGTNTLSVSTNYATSINFTATGTAGTAAAMVLNAGNNQTAVKGTAVAIAPSVRINDAYGNAVSGRSVTYAVASGGGSATGTAATSNGSGIAAVGSWTLGPTLSSNTLTATSAGLSGSPVTFSATGITLAAPTGPPAMTDCETYQYGFPEKTYVDYTISWTAGGGNPGGTGYQIGESTSNNSATAAVIRSGGAATSDVIGSYLVQAGTANRYIWVRHTHGAGFSSWTQISGAYVAPADGCVL